VAFAYKQYRPSLRTFGQHASIDPYDACLTVAGREFWQQLISGQQVDSAYVLPGMS
jgi:hypothetical protein